MRVNPARANEFYETGFSQYDSHKPAAFSEEERYGHVLQKNWLFNNLVASYQQVVDKLVNKLGTSSANTSCWQVVGTALLQVCYRFVTTCAFLLVLAYLCIHALAKVIWLHASLTHVKTHKLLQVCKQVVTNLFTSCRQVVFALLVPNLLQQLGTSSANTTCCSNKSDTVMI
jgi:hypothetical protein